MIVAIIQARMGSTRLPGKVLKKIDGKPMLAYQIERMQCSKLLDKIVIATSTLPQDNVIVDFCKLNVIDYFRGSEKDVLSRYYDCAITFKADIIVRITADCPLIDPEIIDKSIKTFLNEKVDYFANTVPVETSHFPDGSDVEIFTSNALKRANEECKNSNYREHVTFYFWKQDHGFKISQLRQKKNWSSYRLTVDYPEDLEVITYIIKTLKKRNQFGTLKEIINIVNSNLTIKQLNAQYSFGEGW